MNLILIGMPGVGKSTVGVVLAKTLGMDFLDTDLVIQQRENELLQTIINERGMDVFLAAEEAAVTSIQGDNIIIATGGSVVYRPGGMEHLKSLGKVIYLKQHFKVIERRVRNIKTRGIAMGKNKTLWDVYQERKVLYESYAQLTVSCRKKTVEQIVETIIRLHPIDTDI